MHQRTDFVFISQRNDSLPGRARPMALVLLLVPVACVGLLFAVRGAWVIAAFAAIEIFALRIAFRAMQAHSRDFDLVQIGDHEVCVQSWQQGKEQRFRCHRGWARVSVVPTPAGTPGALVMQARGDRIEFGAHLNPEDRVRLAGELRRRLTMPLAPSPIAGVSGHPGGTPALLKEKKP
jgi:uncharacterized membrane protein